MLRNLGIFTAKGMTFSAGLLLSASQLICAENNSTDIIAENNEASAFQPWHGFLLMYVIVTAGQVARRWNHRSNNVTVTSPTPSSLIPAAPQLDSLNEPAACRLTIHHSPR